MTPEQREFLDGLTARVGLRDPPPAPALNPEAAAFLDGFMGLVQDSRSLAEGPDAGDLDKFRSQVMEKWDDIKTTAETTVASQLNGLHPRQRALLQVFEQSPSLLGPLRRSRDEVMNTGLLTWFLKQPDAVGRACRAGFLRALGRTASVDGWHVTAEQVLGAPGRIDVEIVIPGALLVYVEAKIDAEERMNQLSDYRDHLDEVADARQIEAELVFLTVEGRNGNTTVHHTPMRWADLTRVFLPTVLLGGPNATYLAAWLTTLSQDLDDIAESGPVAGWTFTHRVRVLDLLKKTEVSDA